MGARKLGFVILLLIGWTVFFFSCKDEGNPLAIQETFEADPVLFVSDSSGTWQLYSMKSDGSNVKQLTHNPDFPIIDARWSPDGKKIALVSTAGGIATYGPALYLVDADGSNKKRLTNAKPEGFNYATGMGPTWSGNSDRIAIHRVMIPESIGNQDIFLMTLDGQTDRWLTKTKDTTEWVTGWWQDQQWLLFVYFDQTRRDSLGRSSGKTQIAIMDTSGRYLVTLSPFGEEDSSPVLSPNDSTIAFSALTPDGRNLHLMNNDGSNRLRLTVQSHRYETPVDWSPDGQSVLYNTEDLQLQPYENPPREILTINARNSIITRLTPFDYKRANFRATSWKRR